MRIATDLRIRHGLYLTVGNGDDGKLVAICSDGSPQRGHEDVTILTLDFVQSRDEAKEWFARIQVERPWETRQ